MPSFVFPSVCNVSGQRISVPSCSARLGRRATQHLRDNISGRHAPSCPPPSRIANVTELLAALNSAGFTNLRTLEALQLNPPHERALPLRIRSATSALHPLPTTDDAPVPPWSAVGGTCTACVFVRGVSTSRVAGLLLTAKLRALEVAYKAPLLTLKRAAYRSFVQFLSSSTAVPTNISSFLLRRLSDEEVHGRLDPAEDVNQRYVKRCVPAGDVADLLRITGSVEPVFDEVVVVYAPRPASRVLRLSAARANAGAWLERAIQRAVKPASPPPPPPPRSDVAWKDVCVEMYTDVPWGILHHILPSEVQAVRPRARDLLRVDALTLLGLGSAVVTYFRDSSSPFLAIALAGTVGVYAVRIGVGLQTALSGYRARIVEDKFRHILARGEEAVRVVNRAATETGLMR